MRERILKYLETKGLSRYKFYKQTGLSNGYLDKEGDISGSSYEKISYQYPDLNMDWVITGNGDMLRTAEAREVGEGEGIAVYDVDFACGFVEFSDSVQHPIGYYSIPPYNDPSKYGIVRATGDSMLPTIADRSWVVIGKRPLSVEEIIYGDIYAVETNADMRTIKRIIRSEDKSCVRLIPDNQAPIYGSYQDFAKSSIRACYKVYAALNITTF